MVEWKKQLVVILIAACCVTASSHPVFFKPEAKKDAQHMKSHDFKSEPSNG
ncbi:hypothetical protein [Paludifilum halophilum]|uniref:hypothetical protein n=1 Tax=Paludifilum halophilum TaxID=1642702 RepID=UPI00146B2A7A|nr:hypothetical protein [Paludifilum halophilum]